MSIDIASEIHYIEITMMGFLRIVAYAVFAWLWMRAVTRNQSDRIKSGMFKVAGWGLLYTAFDEVHQSWIPGRVGDVLDWTADAIGILLATALFYWLVKKQRVYFKESETASRS